MTQSASAPHLRIETPAGIRILTPGQSLCIGRDDSSDLVIADSRISRRHITFYWSEGWCVADESSTNGSFTSGTRISRNRIERSMSIALGAPDSTLVVKAIEQHHAPINDRTRQRGAQPQPHRTPALPEVPAGLAVMTIGKAQDNSIVVNDVYASHHHARIVGSPGGWVLEDLGSLNGTFVNGHLMSRSMVRQGDIITIGNTDLTPYGNSVVPVSKNDKAGLEISHLVFDIEGGRRLIDNVTLSAPRGTLTAIIGPSGAGKSTLSKIVAGNSRPSYGSVRFDGLDVHANYDAVKTRIGMVPQDDVVHRQLKLRSSLSYAANLRLPNGTTSAERAHQCDIVANQLGLTGHMATRIDKLSGGQRKRASVAMELLTEPALLLLDEPTSGLDPALDRQVMQTLRRLANDDRTVLVVTHSVSYLEYCDFVLILAPGGKTAYFGPPTDVAAYFGTSEWGDIFASLTAHADAHQRRWQGVLASRSAGQKPAIPAQSAPRRPGTSTSWSRQFFTLLARQLNLIVSDRGYFAFLVILPFIVGVLPAVVPGDVGLNKVSGATGTGATEPRLILGLLIVGATFLGLSMTIRNLVAERPIYDREHAVGLSAGAYLVSKALIFGMFSYLSVAIMVVTFSFVKDTPEVQVTPFGGPTFELFLSLGLTAWVGALVGLLVSSFVTSTEQVMPALVIVVMLQLVFNGGLIPVTDSDALNLISKLSPSRWGMAAAASGVDLSNLMAPNVPAGETVEGADWMWKHTGAMWLFDMFVLWAIGLVSTFVTWLRLRRPAA